MASASEKTGGKPAQAPAVAQPCVGLTVKQPVELNAKAVKRLGYRVGRASRGLNEGVFERQRPVKNSMHR